jgi:hypothetical protein
MSTTLRQRPRRRQSPFGLLGRGEGPRPTDRDGQLCALGSDGRGAGRLTLDDLIVDAVQSLSAGGVARCLLCGGEMHGDQAHGESRANEGETGTRWECVDCGTSLS